MPVINRKGVSQEMMMRLEEVDLARLLSIDAQHLGRANATKHFRSSVKIECRTMNLCFKL